MNKMNGCLGTIVDSPRRVSQERTSLRVVDAPQKSGPAARSNLYGMPDVHTDPRMVRGDGIYVEDDRGRVLIDCSSGTFDQPLGYNHPAITEAIRVQSLKQQYVPSPYIPDELVRLAKELVDISPPNLTRVHLRDLTGSTAVEGAIKIAQAATGKRDVISLFGGHHGQTAYTTDISGNAFRRELYPVHMPGVVHVPAPNCFRCFYRQRPETCGMLCVDRIRDFVEYASSGSVACVIVEPIQGNGGNIVPPRDYFKRLRALCDELGMLLIVDEVQTGLGRTGHHFACEYFGLEPHIMVLAKGLGGPTPRAAILVEEGLDKMPRWQHSFTGGSNLISVAVALATLDVLRQPGFLPHVREVGTHLGAGLIALGQDFSFIGDVRGLGLMWGLEIVAKDGSPDNERCTRIAAMGPDYGLLLRTSRYGKGNAIKIRPPLILTHEEADDLLGRLHRLMEAA